MIGIKIKWVCFLRLFKSVWIINFKGRHDILRSLYPLKMGLKMSLIKNQTQRFWIGFKRNRLDS